MNGVCGILSLDDKSFDKNALIESINLAGTMTIDMVSDENFFSVVSFLDTAPLKGQRIYKTSNFIFFFSGDLIGYKEIPWREMETNFSTSNFEWFSTLRGFFSIVVFDKSQKQLSLISDANAQLPMYYAHIDNSFIFSTDLSTFTTLKLIPEFNTEWLYEYLFFNFPIDTTTFLKNVNKLRALSIVTFDFNLESIKELAYSKCIKKSKNILTGKKALDTCIQSFKTIIPKYYCDNSANLVAITGGFDSRTLLSLAPEESIVKTYTYGVKGSNDLNLVSTFINKLNIKHREIFFNEDFKKSLPTLIYDTVRLSGGIQSINRATLLYSYRLLYEQEEKVSVVIGGLAGDFFRGDNGYNDNFNTISKGMQGFFATGEIKIDKKIYGDMFKNPVGDFENHIRNTFDKIKAIYGNSQEPDTFMSYDFYELYPKYFGGEVAIANNYFTLRAPFLDKNLVNLIFETEIGNLGFSMYNKSKEERKKISHKKFILQAKVISANSKFKNTYIRGKPISIYTREKPLSKINDSFIRFLAYLKGHKSPKAQLEDWENWFKYDLKNEFENLLNDKSLLLEYFNLSFVKSVKDSNDRYLLNKLVTTEIILNLIKNRWNIPCNY